MEVANIESLRAQLVTLRDSWKAIWNEAKLVASSLQIEVKLFRDRNYTARKRTRFQYEDIPDENVNKINEDKFTKKANFRNYMFYVILDNVIGELTVCFSEAR